MKFIYSLFQRMTYRLLGFFIPFLEVPVIFLIRIEDGGQLLRIAILCNPGNFHVLHQPPDCSYAGLLDMLHCGINIGQFDSFVCTLNQ